MPFSCAIENKKINIIKKFNEHKIDMSLSVSVYPMELLMNNFLVIGGFWEGFMYIVNIESGEEVCEQKDTEFSVTAMKSDKE